MMSYPSDHRKYILLTLLVRTSLFQFLRLKVRSIERLKTNFISKVKSF